MVGDARDDEALEPLHEANSDNVIHGSDDMHYFPPHSVNHFEFLHYLCEGEGPSNPLLSTMYTIINGGTGRQQQICLPIALADIARQVEVIDLVRREMEHVVTAMKHWTVIWLTNEQSIIIADFMKQFKGFAVPCFADVAIQREERERFMETVAEEGLGEVQFINPEDFPGEGPRRSAPAKAA
ncbi:hypothetical protein D8674_041485 [Pyrus ussuriensis x Pyrus communis]|uniref:Uncharacterized protein n=1 Tax=Pyrus ussuriensis x Pyrus communis TaxID=2448454 RepID=A0A5N5H755_9ROSA|nr:hypothetical protein D8674_041485 [Pyrus ussuriensis x Pyrus communis]